MQATDSLTRGLTGELPFTLIAASLLSLPVSLVVLRLYRRAVEKSMRATTGTAPAAHLPKAPGAAPSGELRSVTVATPSDATGNALFAAARAGPWRTAAVQVLAGLTFGIFFALVALRSDGAEVLPLRLSLLSLAYAWPVVFAVWLVTPPRRAGRARVVAAYAVGFSLLAWLGVQLSPGFTFLQAVGLWLILNLAPTLLLLATLNRRVRAVGPIVLAFMCVAGAGAVVAPVILERRTDWLAAVVDIGVGLGSSAGEMLVGIMLLGFLVCAAAAWPLLWWIRSAYERKAISDQSLTLDAIWLVFALWHAVPLAFAAPAWVLGGPAAFLIYRIAAAGGTALLIPGRRDRTAPSLLLLRAFSLGRKSERLFDALTLHWRYIGPVQLIAGPDLATTAIEPHELLDFATGKLARRFIDGPAALDVRLAEADHAPDRDGRFRVNEFFCRETAWRLALTRLVERSDVVLMDLRGFTAQHAGCIHEIRELVAVVPLAGVIFAVDGTTDRGWLDRVLQDAWASAPADSPNQVRGSTEARLMDLRAGERDAQRLLLTLSTSTLGELPARAALAPATPN